MVLVTYDVNTQERSGVKRLQKVAKVCENIGRRVQNSVFECLVLPEQLVELRHQLISTIDHEKDSIRIYMLGSKWKRKIEHYGAKLSYEQDEALIL